MKMRFMTFVAAAALTAGLLTPAMAEERTYEFDTVHSKIIFFVDHLGFSKSMGQFLEFDGYFTFDPDTAENAKTEVIIDTSSISMDNYAWDEHMKNEDFFDVEKHPEMSFRSTAVEITGDNTGQLTGDLTLLGVTQPVTLDVTYNKSGPHPMNADEYRAGFSATGQLNRSDFGMNYGLPMVGDEVKIRLEIEGIAQQSDPAESEPENDTQD